LANARRANASAAALAAGLREVPGARLLRSVDANEVFVALPISAIATLEAEGFGFYRWPVADAAPDVAIRLVTSYATREEDVAGLLRAAGRAASQEKQAGRA
jgi:threonine aldolase